VTGDVEERFARALELEGEDRRRFVAGIAADDPIAGAELARLLAHCDDDRSPLDRSPWRDVLAPDGESTPPPSLPERVGPYRVVREIGRGGMGRVFLAEEVTADFSRRLALKVVDRPFADPAAIRRFREEVRILSLLDHPGIARFLHGGRSPEGTWYLALEYVDGVDLLTWADRRGLDLEARVRLFVAALDPVRYAHERGVVHRDLKPRHLLVDDEGRPRLLDFGISKLLDPGADAELTATLPGARVLTPAYASPEQFRGETVSPSSDVFALGIVLYELVSGHRPFEAVALSPVALEHAVLTRDPAPPSVVGTSAAGTADADLDAICLKALRKAPAERYRDAGELRADLERYLAGRPVEARRGALRRAVRRLATRRSATIAAGAVLITIAALYALVRASAERVESSTHPPAPAVFPFDRLGEADLAALERDFAADPSDLRAGARLALALDQRRRLPEAKLIAARLRQIPGAKGDPLLDYVDGTLAHASDEPQRALVLFTRARDGALRTGRGELLGQIRAARGRLLSTLGEREEGYREMSLARSDFERAGDFDSLGRVLNDLAIEHLIRGELALGQELLERAIDATVRGGGSAMLMRTNLGQLATFRGDPATGDRYLSAAVAERREEGNPFRLGEALAMRAEALDDLGRRSEAIAALDEAIGLLRRAEDTSALATALHLRGSIAVSAGDSGRTGPIAEELERIGTSTGNYLGLSGAYFLRALSASAAGEQAAMRRHFTAAAQIATVKEHHDYAAAIEAAHSAAELRAGDLDAAASVARRSLDRLPAGSSTSAPRALATAVLARVELADDRTDSAQALLESFGDDAEESSSVSRRIALSWAFAELARRRGRPAEARDRLDRSIELARRSGRRLEELELRLARLDPPLADEGARRGELEALLREASESGFAGLRRPENPTR